MSDIVGEAVLRIRTDDSDVNRGITSAGKKGGEGYSKGFKDGLKGLAGAAGLAFGADKAVDFLKSGIEAATSFQDETGALNVIIGKEGTAAVQKFGETSAKAFGISKVQALEASHTFATFGKSAGLSGKGLGDFSVKFASLAGDLASFNGGSTEDAITAIGAALRGETEPIRRYGVLLDDMSLRQEAVRQGIIKNIKTALTPQQRVLAAQALIFKQTKDAQGDFARTSDSAANSQKALTAKMADLRLEIGTKLLPVETKVVQALSEFITEMEDGTGAGGKFVEVLHETADVGKAVFNFINGIPGPVKKFGAEAVVAAFALSKVNGAISAFRASGLVSNLGSAETRMLGLKQAAGLAAGAGGMLLLADGAKKADTNLGRLEITAGAIATGFAVGGPIGAGLAAAAAGFLELRSAIDATSGSELPTPKQLGITDIINGLDEATGKANEFSKLSIFNFLSGKTKGAPPKGVAVGTTIRDTAKLYGIPTREVIDAMSGNVKALARIKATLNAAVKSGKQPFASTDRDVLLDSIRTTVKGYHEQQRALQDQTAATKDYGTALKGLPSRLVTKIEQEGIRPSLAGVEALTKGYKNLDRKQVTTLLKAAGVPATKANIQEVLDKAKEYGRQRPTAHVYADTSKARASLNSLLPLLRSVVTGFGSIDIPGDGKGRLQSGTNDWRGGLTTINETGPELIWLPKHAQVTSAPRTQQLLARTGAGGGASAKDIGVAVTKALVAAGVSGATIINPVPETASASQSRISANTAFLLGG